MSNGCWSHYTQRSQFAIKERLTREAHRAFSGTRSSGEIWKKQQDALETLGHRTVAIDLPGHGANVADVFTLSSAFTLLTQEINDLGGKVILVGDILRGYVSLAYAAEYPERVEAVLAAGCSI